ncbi:MAG: PTS lactose/cellobiose transporter subunit IIA [Lachnospiraceae bacterium]|nr:PTS lactose/cellobiose transporter subunit IIA [Lachnospiraceae bacterium]MCD7805969.1 PTS lactose/cellobiose transporter subunit IIA [Lachnospiraceae bacterium]MCD8132165.1 PTS lactose/cellobiose transporter subunit IIA [Lachnospiraceae bacterium]MCD8326541.1 PTS lactose/cellobiose transporter subunit IIA [Lachnospiraceae bacterium]
MIAMSIIASAGDARSDAFAALAAAKEGNFEEADRLLAEAKEAGVGAHKAQTDLLFAEANGNAPEMNVLLVHAQDHFMTSMLAEELIREIIDLYKLLKK